MPPKKSGGLGRLEDDGRGLFDQTRPENRHRAGMLAGSALDHARRRNLPNFFRLTGNQTAAAGIGPRNDLSDPQSSFYPDSSPASAGLFLGAPLCLQGKSVAKTCAVRLRLHTPPPGAKHRIFTTPCS
jgi:hypothetical protein